jgi:hypothetical protein
MDFIKNTGSRLNGKSQACYALGNETKGELLDLGISLRESSFEDLWREIILDFFFQVWSI